MSQDAPRPQINASKIAFGGGIAGAIFTIGSMLIFLTDLPMLWYMSTPRSFWAAHSRSFSASAVTKPPARRGFQSRSLRQPTRDHHAELSLVARREKCFIDNRSSP